MDFQAVGVGSGAVLTALGAIVTGIITGRNSRAKDELAGRAILEQARIAHDLAEETASKDRIIALAADASDARQRLREAEDMYETKLRRCRAYAQRGWDLANFHFGLLKLVTHLMNNVLQVNEGESDALVRSAVKSAAQRMQAIKVPTSLEDPIAATYTETAL